MKACDAIRERLFRTAATANDAPLAGRSPNELTMKKGQVLASDGASDKLTDIFKRIGIGSIEEYAEFVPDGFELDAVQKVYAGKMPMTSGSHGKKVMYVQGAEFVEVRVLALTCEIRVPRIVGAFAAGRLMDAWARS